MKKMLIGVLYFGLVISNSVVAQGIDLKTFAQRFENAERLAWQEGKFEELEAIEDANIIYHGYPIKSFADHKQYIVESRKTISESTMDMEYLTGDGSLFAVNYTSSATVNGEKITTSALMLFKVKNEKITEVWLGVNSAPVQ